MEMKFYRCRHCGNVVAYLHRSGVKVVCCGEEMKELIPNTQDGAKEKHVPVYTVKGNKVTVQVGEVAHPMTEEHFIEWIALQTKKGNQRVALKPGDKPEAVFALLEDDEVEAVYAYCNLHGLYKA